MVCKVSKENQIPTAEPGRGRRLCQRKSTLGRKASLEFFQCSSGRATQVFSETSTKFSIAITFKSQRGWETTEKEAKERVSADGKRKREEEKKETSCDWVDCGQCEKEGEKGRSP